MENNNKKQTNFIVMEGFQCSSLGSKQVVSFYTRKPVKNVERVWQALNGILPDDIRVMSVTAVPHKFHARYAGVHVVAL